MYYFDMKDFFPNELFYVDQTIAIIDLKPNVLQKKNKVKFIVFGFCFFSPVKSFSPSTSFFFLVVDLIVLDEPHN